jgi:cell division protein FtsQ
MHRHLVRRRLAGSLVAVGVAAVAAWVLFFSALLALDPAQVRLSGQGSVVDPAAVRAVVETRAGTPLPRLDTVDLRRDLLDVPGVRAAEVTRVWPRGLDVRVVSREPVAAVQRAGGGFTLLDPEAVPVGRVDAPPAGLPIIAVPLDDPGSRAALAVLTVLRGLPDELLVQVTSASAQSQDTVHLVLADGAQVEWGSADEIALKVRVLQTLRAAEPSRGAAVYDLSAPTMPITRS